MQTRSKYISDISFRFSVQIFQFFFIFSGKFNILHFYSERFLRVTPVILFLMVVTVACYSFLTQNYPYAFHNDMLRPCEKYWWSTILLVQNYVNRMEMVRKITLGLFGVDSTEYFQCMPWTWYLGADFQMYLISPALIYLAFKFGRRNLVSLLLALVVSSSSAVYNIAMDTQTTVQKMSTYGSMAVLINI